MSFNENPSVKNIVNDIKKLTGKKIAFIEKPDLATHAKVKVARQGMNEHVIFFNPKYSKTLSHLVAHECGHIFRIFSASPDQRLMPVHTRNCRRLFVASISSDVKSISSRLKVDMNPLIDIWLGGLITQLTNHPEDIKIETWIFNTYPELREIQANSIDGQFEQAKKALTSVSVVENTPDSVYLASNIMNYVFFKYLGSFLGKEYTYIFDKRNDIKTKGEELFEITEKYNNNTNMADFKMIDRWAAYLGMEKWFDWADFEDIPENYMEI